MEFRPNLTSPPPKNLYPCLATLTLGAVDNKPSRRMSSGSGDEEGGGGGGLMRVISGPRRNTTFGQVADRGDGRKSLDGGRRSFDAGTGNVGGGVPGEKGTWYWRVQAGVDDTHLVLMPLSQPPNPLLTSAPAPLSEAMPSHSTHHGHSGDHEQQESFGTKVKNLFTGHRKNSKSDDHTEEPKHETIVDQNASGEQMPSAAANAIGADNVNANAETGWPGFINGEKLGAVIVQLGSIDHTHVKLHQHKKESCFVTVPVTAHLAGVGQSSEMAPKSGFIKFEFDKDWIGAKGEAELLHHYITTAAQNPPQPTSNFTQNFQLGATGSAGHTPPMMNDIAPDHDVSTASSGKVAGTAM